MNRYNPVNDFIGAITEKTSGNRIRAYFRNGKQATYTESIFELLKTDPDIEFITSENTGEIIYPA